MCDARLQGIMGSVSSLLSGGRGCRVSDHKVKKGFQGKRGLLKHGTSHEAAATNNNSKFSSGNSDDFFYIKVSHKTRAADDGGDEAASRRGTPTELMLSARLDQATEKSFMSGFPRTSSSVVETHNSLNTILGTKLSPVARSKRGMPEPKHEASTGSPSDSGISGSSWTSDSANKWTNGDGETSNSRSVSVLSDCIKADGKNAEFSDRRSPFSDLNSVSLDDSATDRKLQSSGSDLQLNASEVSQHALRAQQLLQLQVMQLQEDKERLQEEVDQLIRDRDSAERSLPKQNHLTPTLEETQWEVCQKAGEISLLKKQLKESQADVVNKLSEIVSLKSSLRDVRSKLEELEEKNRQCEEALCLRNTEMQVCENELQRKKNEAELLREKVGKLESDLKEMKCDLAVAEEEHRELLSIRSKLQEQQRQLQVCRDELAEHKASGDLDALQKEVERLREELKEQKQKEEKLQSSFHSEKQTWNKEKEKVIHYQKQLQYNYIQMQRKNQDLEKMLRERTVSLKKRTVKKERGHDVQEAELPYDDMVATEI